MYLFDFFQLYFLLCFSIVPVIVDYRSDSTYKLCLRGLTSSLLKMTCIMFNPLVLVIINQKIIGVGYSGEK